MRTAQSSAPARTAGHRRSCRVPRVRTPVPYNRKEPLTGAYILFAILFLLGYVPGIVLGRLDSNTLGSVLASYYSDLSCLVSGPSLFLAQISAAFLQLLFVTLCGFSAFGTGGLTVFFLARGAFLGYCASNLFVQEGFDAFWGYWRVTCLPNLTTLFLCLWLSGYAVQISRNLFQSAFLGGAPRGQMSANARRFGVRCALAVLLSIAFSIVFCGMVSLIFRFFL